jgi:hypothetical protein
MSSQLSVYYSANEFLEPEPNPMPSLMLVNTQLESELGPIPPSSPPPFDGFGSLSEDLPSDEGLDIDSFLDPFRDDDLEPESKIESEANRSLELELELDLMPLPLEAIYNSSRELFNSI